MSDEKQQNPAAPNFTPLILANLLLLGLGLGVNAYQAEVRNLLRFPLLKNEEQKLESSSRVQEPTTPVLEVLADFQAQLVQRLKDKEHADPARVPLGMEDTLVLKLQDGSHVRFDQNPNKATQAGFPLYTATASSGILQELYLFDQNRQRRYAFGVSTPHSGSSAACLYSICRQERSPHGNIVLALVGSNVQTKYPCIPLGNFRNLSSTTDPTLLAIQGVSFENSGKVHPLADKGIGPLLDVTDPNNLAVIDNLGNNLYRRTPGIKVNQKK